VAIYVYASGETNFDSMGICGALTPKRCEFSEKRNGMSQIVMEHPIDDYGRWAMLQAGCILKVDVPVRTTPEIDGTSLVTTVEKWKVKTTATSGQRKLYSKSTGGRVIKTLPIWADKAKTVRFEVTVVRKGANRYKAKTKYGSGWIPLSGLEYSVTSTIGDDPAAIETVEPAWTVKPQLFRMRDPKKTHKGVTVTASHIFYDLAGNITTYEPYSSAYPAWSSGTAYTVGGMAARGGLNYFCIVPHTNHAPPNATYWVDADTCFAALSKITGNCLIAHEFEGYTNLKDQRIGASWTRAKAVEALLAPKTGLVDRWGAELVRDNFEFYILREAGVNRGVRIEWKKNLLGIEYTTDITDVIARIMPIGKTYKGKPLYLVPGTYTVNGTTVTIAAGETWVTSPQAGDYAAPLMDTLDTNIKAKSGSASDVLNARLKMIEAALNQFTDTECDQPSVNVRIDFVTLSNTVEYEQFKRLDDVYLCDRVRVRHPGIQVDVLTEVIETVWDCLTGRFKSIELGRVQLDRTRVTTPVWELPAGIPGTLMAPGTVDAGALDDYAADIIVPAAVVMVAVSSSAGSIIKGQSTAATSTLTAKVYKGGAEITSGVDASRFSWTRESGNASADAAWAAAHAGVKTVSVTAAEFAANPAIYHCDVADEPDEEA
jgi:phage minor structural protein